MILLGEMRDLETISTALTAAETGHLVFGTLHTQSASGNDRPDDRRLPGRAAGPDPRADRRLAPGRRHPVLVPTADGEGRVAALEILIPDDAIRNLIRQAKVEQIYSYMQTGSRSGMQTMEQALAELVVNGTITPEDAIVRSSRRSELIGLIERGGSTISVAPTGGELRLAGV